MRSNINEKQRRLKEQLQYAKLTSLTLGNADTMFRIMDTSGPSWKLKTVEQLNESLKINFGKTSQESEDES